mmetsp:Transcript_93013/g.259143  ORF Transcript_93013/g.259143 Transcript_93013/m.259143 type:complete len:312 (+) Transcript_93013:2183-3118(+)
MLRFRAVTPPPQVTEQLDQLPHLLHLQSMGHPAVSQLESSFVEPLHGFPPCWAVITERVRVLTPPPQVFVQIDHLPQSSNEQSSGHGSSLHASVAVILPSHSAPPYAASTRFWREWVRSPPPQDFEHRDHSPQLFHWQATGQGSALHEVLSLPWPSQAFPPEAAVAATSRLLVIMPLPQVRVHFDQLAQSPHAQSTGHPWGLQSFLSSSGPLQLLPPCWAALEIPRVLVALPPPHVLLHSDHSFQESHWQSTGQGFFAHSFFSRSEPVQSFPPHCAMAALLRLRSWSAPPHVLPHGVQPLQDPHWHCTGQF